MKRACWEDQNAGDLPEILSSAREHQLASDNPSPHVCNYDIKIFLFVKIEVLVNSIYRTRHINTGTITMSVPVFSDVGASSDSSTLENPKLQEEIRLYENAREREEYDNRANVFALIQTIQALEKAYLKDAVVALEYEKSCNLLLDQLNAAFKLIKGQSFPDLEAFMKRYHMECQAALMRIKEGRPLTIRDDRGNMSKSIAEIVSTFITIMDRLRLEIRAMDELHLDVKELHETMCRMSALPADFEGKKKVHKWLLELNSMQASDELSEEQARQMLFDLESAYNDFNRFLANQ